MIDVLIPTIKSDLPMLGKTIDSVRVNVIDGLRNIFVVAKKDDDIYHFCKEKNVEYLVETEFIGFDKTDFDIGMNIRNGWLYQQLLKLNGDIVCETENFLVIDSDHVLLKPHIFVDDEHYYFYISDEYHTPYFNAINGLFNGKYKKSIKESFISDKMVFNKALLKEMKDEMKKVCNEEKWYDAIIKKYDRMSFCGFSEFETYGTYAYSNVGKEKIILKDCNRIKLRDNIVYEYQLNELINKYNNYNSLTILK